MRFDRDLVDEALHHGLGRTPSRKRTRRARASRKATRPASSLLPIAPSRGVPSNRGRADD
jgi:hypothetical protein